MLREVEPFQSATQAKKNLVQAIKSVAGRLGNTPSVCRKCYVHPAILDHYLAGSMMSEVHSQIVRETAGDVHGLREEELAVLRLLERRVTAAAA
jgi:DNA topoisomerase-1